MAKQIFYSQVSEGVAGLFCAVILLFGSLKWIVNAQAILGWLPLFVSLSLYEPPRRKLEKSKTIENIKVMVQILSNSSRLFLLITFNGIIYSSATWLAVWTYQDFWQKMGIPLPIFGILWAMTNLVVGFFGRVAVKIESFLGIRKTLLLISFLPILGYGGMSFFSYYYSQTPMLALLPLEGLFLVFVYRR